MVTTLTPTQAAEKVLAGLRAEANAENAAGMARFGISSKNTLGVPTPVIWKLASQAIRDVDDDRATRAKTAELLWESGVHEARIAAAEVDAPELVTRERIERWALDLDSWDVCDQLCMRCWWQAPDAWAVAVDFSERDEPFVKRVAFALIARIALKRTDLDAEAFVPLLALIEREARDERNEVKKAVSWALRQTGKRDTESYALAIESAERILVEQSDSTSARWIAHDALRELRSDAVKRRLKIDERW